LEKPNLGFPSGILDVNPQNEQMKSLFVATKQNCRVANTQSVGMAAIERWLPGQIANAAAYLKVQEWPKGAAIFEFCSFGSRSRPSGHPLGASFD